MKIANKMNILDRPLSGLQAELVRALPSLLPAVTIRRVRPQVVPGARRPHLLVEVLTPSREKRTLAIDVRSATLPPLVPGAGAGYPVVASQFLSPRLRALYRQRGMGYVDLAGNCYLEFGNFHFERIVDRNPFPRRGRPPSLFSPVSSRIVRAMLEEPTRAWRVSELAAAAQVSLGQTSNVCRALLAQGYSVRERSGVRVTQPGALLDAWRDEEPVDRHRATAYYAFDDTPQRLMARLAALAADRRWRYAVTSLAAASLVAPFVRGVSTVHWYVWDAVQAAEWVKALDLRPVESGPNAILLVPNDAGVFYRSRAVEGVTVVGDVQLYLDLWREPARGREQAEFLRKEQLTF